MLLCGMSLSFAACSDDDDENSEAQQEQTIAGDPYLKTGEKGSELLRLVSQLADVDSLPDDWRTTEFEPTEGKILDASQPFVRSVPVMNMAEARDLFRSYIGQNFDEKLPVVEWKVEDVGSLTFKTVGQADCLATVDVRVKQMPHLEQLRFVPLTAMGDNAMKYTPYYRIGDVVKDKDGCYWICVRAAGGPKEKDKTHWVTMQLLTENSKVSGFKSNVLTKAANLKVPQNLGGTETEHLKYFAQLMYLLQRPQEYGQNMGADQVMAAGLGALGTDSQADETAYSQADLEAIAQLWNCLDLWKRVLPKGINKEFFLKDEVKMLYNGHSNALLGSNVSLFLCTQSGTCRSIQNLSKPTWSKNDATKRFDIREYALNGKATTSNVPGIGEAIVVRMCTGKELANNLLLQPSYDERIKNVENLVVSRFRLNNYSSYFHIGDVFKDEEGSRWFVISSAGFSLPDDPQINSPYSYLVSFDNVKASADHSHATNLPKRKLAMKAAYFMYVLASFDIYQRRQANRWEEFSDPNVTPSKQMVYQINQHAEVDLQYLFDVIESPKGIRQAFLTTTFAYDDGTSGQKLLRMIHDTQRQGNAFRLSFWSRYPLVHDTSVFPEPGNRSMFYSESAETGAIFENVQMMAVDVADQSMVSNYADDFFAKQPFDIPAENTGRRAVRSQADTRARKVENFFYNREQMKNRSLPLSMWNEPVLFFRATKVFDHGEDHDMTTVDGRKLKVVHKTPFNANVVSDYNLSTSGIVGATISAYSDTYQDGEFKGLAKWIDEDD